MGTAIKHPVSDRVKPSFVIFDIRTLWRSGLNQTYATWCWLQWLVIRAWLTGCC